MYLPEEVTGSKFFSYHLGHSGTIPRLPVGFKLGLFKQLIVIGDATGTPWIHS